MRQVITENRFAGDVREGPHLGQRHDSISPRLKLSVPRARWERVLKRKPRVAEYVFFAGGWILDRVERPE